MTEKEGLASLSRAPGACLQPGQGLLRPAFGRGVVDLLIGQGEAATELGARLGQSSGGLVREAELNPVSDGSRRSRTAPRSSIRTSAAK